MNDPIKKKYSIRTARWDISPYCNLNCLHCCAEGLFDSMNPNCLNAESAINLLNKLWENNITQLNILGKEPFLHPHINTILQYACKQGFDVDITTNGTVIKDKDIGFLVSVGLRNIFFSLDGSSPQANDIIRGGGAFHKTLVTIQKFLAEKKRQGASLQINVNTVLTKINALDILNIIDLCSSSGVNFFNLSHLEPMGNAFRHLNRLMLKPEEEFEVVEGVIKRLPNYPELKFNILSSKPKILEYFYKKYKVVFPVSISGCKACTREIYIGPAGEISPCLSCYANSPNILDGYFKHGKTNIFELKDKPIYEMPCCEEFRSAFPLNRDSYKNYVPCNSCPYLTTICYPCPLGSLSSRPYLEDFCLIAEKKLSELEG
jgi:MoaA/NifB/PqqE/SkfB family radical SAM enzyme